jgi:hypothetical protein
MSVLNLVIWSYRGRSSAWLERLPVTQEVEGSSPFGPAKNQKCPYKGHFSFVERFSFYIERQVLALFMPLPPSIFAFPHVNIGIWQPNIPQRRVTNPAGIDRLSRASLYSDFNQRSAENSSSNIRNWTPEDGKPWSAPEKSEAWVAFESTIAHFSGPPISWTL